MKIFCLFIFLDGLFFFSIETLKALIGLILLSLREFIVFIKYFISHTFFLFVVYGLNGTKLGSADVPSDGDEVALEVDLRSNEKSKRTLHFFVKGKQQRIYFTGLPDRVKFAVCFFSLFILINNYFQLNLYYQNTKILFKSLEELKEPSANRNEGDEKKWS